MYFYGRLPDLQLPDFLWEKSDMVFINGVEQNAAGLTVEHYLETANYDSARIVVERNGEIVPKTQYGQTVLNDGDTVEVISFVGGG